MRIKQLVALFTCLLSVTMVGSTTLALLPVYMQELGASEQLTGIYFSLAFAALTLGAVVSGPLSDRFQARKWTIIVAGVVAIPATFLMGQVSSIGLLVIMTMIVYFIGSLTGTTVSILAGMYANPASRGLIFGTIAAAPGVASIITGSTTGLIVERWGFDVLFTVLALAWGAQVIAGITLEDRVGERHQTGTIQPSTIRLPRAVWLLVTAVFLISVANFSATLGRPLAMSTLGFSATAITSTIAVGGLVTLPLPFVVGWLSDRVGRRPLMMLACFALSIGAFVLSIAFDVWQFQLSAALFVFGGTAGSVSNAFVTDLAPPEALGAALSRLASAPPLAGILGYSLTGFAIQGVGVQTTFLIVAVLPVCAIVLLLAIHQKRAHSFEALKPD